MQNEHVTERKNWRQIIDKEKEKPTRSVMKSENKFFWEGRSNFKFIQASNMWQDETRPIINLH